MSTEQAAEVARLKRENAELRRANEILKAVLPNVAVRTIFATAAAERPKPLIPYNPAHIRGAGNTKRVHQVRPAPLA